MQCELNFQDRPKSFDNDCAKVIYAQSYLKGMALNWFEPELLLGNPQFCPLWMDDYSKFTQELQANFGPHDPVGDAEHCLDNLSMSDNHKITKYVIKFNCHASQVHGYGEGALWHHFYNRLPEWLKDEITCVGKPYSLHDMQVLVQQIDAHYWECKDEQACHPKSIASTPSLSNQPSCSTNKSAKLVPPPTSNPSSTPNSSGKSSKGSGQFQKKAPATSDLSSKLGKDGKLTNEEHCCRFENNLCMFCGQSGHIARDCPCSSSCAAKARAADIVTLAVKLEDSSESKK